jgi:hypothetical protein
MRIIMGNRDWAQSIAEELGYYIDFVSLMEEELIKDMLLTYF